MDCKREGCNEPVTGKSQYCSGACRTRASRASVTPFHRASVTDVTVPASVTPGRIVTRTASLDDYKATPSDYATRAEPELLNWGPWMSADQLASAGLKANRVAIPGDWDYAGVCKQVDGEWAISPDPTNIKTMTDLDLQLKLKSYPGASWVNSPEHREVLRRKQAAPVHEQAGVGASQA